MNITRVALDLAKQVIQVHAVDRSDRALVRKPVRRAQLLPFFRELPPCEVGMEACSGAHHWGRQLQAMGHRVRLLPPQYVKPFVLGQKNDANDAAAICAAMTRQEIPAVAVKTIAQQDQQALHRIRSARVAQRTALVNQTRANGGRVIAVGTTVVRALETTVDSRGISHPGRTWTDLVIGSDHALGVVDGLITGWHEPESTHLDLLEAVAGRRLLAKSYRNALEQGYLWHEFGDSHLILRD